jgi:molybdopterin biosynthesis enzyme
MKTLLTPDEARHIVLAHTPTVLEETVPHDAALGRTLAHDIISPLELPPFDNSSVDGYALRAEDTRGAAPHSPVTLAGVRNQRCGNLNRVLD